jgi:hypothetical protein
MAAAERAGVRRVNWDRLEEALVMSQPTLFSAPAADATPPAAAPADGEIPGSPEPAAVAPDVPRETPPPARTWLPRMDNWLGR